MVHLITLGWHFWEKHCVVSKPSRFFTRAWHACSLSILSLSVNGTTTTRVSNQNNEGLELLIFHHYLSFFFFFFDHFCHLLSNIKLIMQVLLLLCFVFIAYSRLHELLLRKCDIAQLVESSTPFFFLMYRLYLEVVKERKVFLL